MKIKQRVYSFICLLMMSYTDLAVGGPRDMLCGLCVSKFEDEIDRLKDKNKIAQAKIKRLSKEKRELGGEQFERIRNIMDMYERDD